MSTDKITSFATWIILYTLLYTFWHLDHVAVRFLWKHSGNSLRLYFLGLQKSLQMVIAAMKLKDAYSLEQRSV